MDSIFLLNLNTFITNNSMNNTIKNGIKSTKDLGMKYSSYLDEKILMR